MEKGFEFKEVSCEEFEKFMKETPEGENFYEHLKKSGTRGVDVWEHVEHCKRCLKKLNDFLARKGD